VSVGDATEAASDSDDPDATGASETDPSNTSASDDSESAESVGGSGPMIVLLTATPPEITESDVVTFLAQVVDPDGAEDIVGGLLKNEAGDATYGAFVQISEGSFSVALDWNTIDAVEPLTYSGDAMRTFSAEFTDTAGNAATETVDVGFDCGGLAICDGACTELGTDENCAACGDACGGEDMCANGRCNDGCGNGVIEPGEQCEGGNLDGFNCESLGFGPGVLTCDANCFFDTSNCS